MFKRNRKPAPPLPQAAQIEHERLNSLINSMADAVIAVDESKKVVVYNAAALNVLDLNTIKPNTDVAKIIKPVTSDNHPVDIASLIETTTTPYTSRDLRLQYTDNSSISLYMSIAPVRLGYGTKGQGGHVLLLRDITREKSLEDERDEFISVISHELRTPIAIAEGNISNAQLIADRTEGIDPAIKQALGEAYNQVLFLAGMINDLSTLGRAEQGSLKLEIEAIDVKALVAELVSNYTPEAQKKGLEMKSEIIGEIGELHSSKLYVREVLQNFITNAIKYTSQGSVTLEASYSSQGIHFAVRDTGIGISKGDQDRVFDKFFRSEDYRTRQANGTGLGLYVTSKITRLLHAEITLESELNKGSTFSIFVPNLENHVPKPA